MSHFDQRSSTPDRDSQVVEFFKHQVNYLSKLQHLLSSYVTPLLSPDKQHVLSLNEHQIIFRNIHLISKLQNEFVNALKSNCGLRSRTYENVHNNHSFGSIVQEHKFNNNGQNDNSNYSNYSKFGLIVDQWTTQFDTYLKLVTNSVAPF